MTFGQRLQRLPLWLVMLVLLAVFLGWAWWRDRRRRRDEQAAADEAAAAEQTAAATPATTGLVAPNVYAPAMAAQSGIPMTPPFLAPTASTGSPYYQQQATPYSGNSTRY